MILYFIIGILAVFTEIIFICINKKPLGIVHIHDLLRLTS